MGPQLDLYYPPFASQSDSITSVIFSNIVRNIKEVVPIL